VDAPSVKLALLQVTPVLRVIHRFIAGSLLKQAGLKHATANSGAATLIPAVQMYALWGYSCFRGGRQRETRPRFERGSPGNLTSTTSAGRR